MRRRAGLTKQAIAGIIIVIVVIAAAAVLMMQGGGQPTPTTTATSPTTSTTTTTTTIGTTTTTTLPTTTTTTTTTATTTQQPQLKTITIGSSTIRVPDDFYEFVQKVKNGEISVTINFWTSMLPFEVDAITQVVNEFESEYPGIKVSYTGTQQNMKEAVKAGVLANDLENTANVFTWAHDWTGELAEGGFIVPLDKYLPPETIEDLQAQYLTNAYSAGVYNLHLYGLPWAAEAIALVCNTEMVSTPPKTFAELEQIMQQYYNPDNDTYGLAYQIDPYFVYPFVTAFGGYYYDDETGSVGVNSTGTKEGIKFLIQHVLAYEFTGDLGHETQLNIFQQGKAPCMITGPWDIPAIKENIPNITVSAIPPIDDKVPRPFSGIKLLWISKVTEQDQNMLYASILFVMWFSLNDDTLKSLVDNAGFIPVKKSVVAYISEHIDQYPIVAGFIESISNSIPMPKSPQMAKVWGPVSEALNAILAAYSENGPEAAIEAVDQALDNAQESILQSLSG